IIFYFFSSRRRHTSFSRDWSSDVCSSDLALLRVLVDDVPDPDAHRIRDLLDHRCIVASALLAHVEAMIAILDYVQRSTRAETFDDAAYQREVRQAVTRALHEEHRLGHVREVRSALRAGRLAGAVQREAQEDDTLHAIGRHSRERL